jgi:hypothetical protein
MDKEMKTMIREIREDTAEIREENKLLRKELVTVRGAKERISGSERGNERKRRKMADGEDRTG